MIVTIPELGFELRPYTQGPCWQLFERVTDRTDNEGVALSDSWRSCGIYPSKLEHGFALIRERAARRSKVACDLSGAIRELRAMDDAMQTAYQASLERSATH